MKISRREFTTGLLAAGTLPLMAAEKKPMIKGALLHLGSNMWGDFLFDPDQSYQHYRNYVLAEDACWKETADFAAKKQLNLVVMDVGEALVYPSHPELAVKGSWSVEKMRAELTRMRGLGLEVIPKLNFSAGHDPWLKHYSRMLSTPEYYKVIDDLIADVVDIFDHPRFFHIGCDEECHATQRTRAMATMRQGELWWHDINYFAKCILKRGSRPMMFSDKMWWGRKEFLSKMNKDIVQSPWYYQEEFTDDVLSWDYEFEKSGAWPHKRHGAATIVALDEAGFEQIPCCSNCYRPLSVEKFVKFCSERLYSHANFLGLYVAPWGMSVPGRMYTLKERKDNKRSLRGSGTALTKEGISQFSAALSRYSS